MEDVIQLWITLKKKKREIERVNQIARAPSANYRHIDQYRYQYQEIMAKIGYLIQGQIIAKAKTTAGNG